MCWTVFRVARAARPSAHRISTGPARTRAALLLLLSYERTPLCFVTPPLLTCNAPSPQRSTGGRHRAGHAHIYRARATSTKTSGGAPCGASSRAVAPCGASARGASARRGTRSELVKAPATASRRRTSLNPSGAAASDSAPDYRHDAAPFEPEAPHPLGQRPRPRSAGVARPRRRQPARSSRAAEGSARTCRWPRSAAGLARPRQAAARKAAGWRSGRPRSAGARRPACAPQAAAERGHGGGASAQSRPSWLEEARRPPEKVDDEVVREDLIAKPPLKRHGRVCWQRPQPALQRPPRSEAASRARSNAPARAPPRLASATLFRKQGVRVMSESN